MRTECRVEKRKGFPGAEDQCHMQSPHARFADVGNAHGQSFAEIADAAQRECDIETGWTAPTTYSYDDAPDVRIPECMSAMIPNPTAPVKDIIIPSYRGHGFPPV